MTRCLLVSSDAALIGAALGSVPTDTGSVIAVAPGLAAAVADGVETMDADPAKTTGRGVLGDLMRQRGPWRRAILLLSEADVTPFADSGLDTDLHQLNAELAASLALCKGLMAAAAGGPAGEVHVLRVLSDRTVDISALCVASDAFLAAFAACAPSHPGLSLQTSAISLSELSECLRELLRPTR